MTSKNKYLEKISGSVSVKDYTDNLNRESQDLLKNIGANLVIADRKLSPNLYHKAITTGGHGTYWDVKVDSNGNLSNNIDILHTNPDWKVRLRSPIHSLLERGETSKLISAIALRHETLEALETHNRLLPTIHRLFKENSKDPIPSNVVIKDKNGKVIGEHLNLSVLMQESNLVSSSPYRDRLTKLINLRNTYESDILKNLTGKSYGDQFDEHDLAKGRHY